MNLGEAALQGINHQKEISPFHFFYTYLKAIFSSGLEESGAVKCHWAIEYDEAAANAYRINHPDCRHVFNKDCNDVLEVSFISEMLFYRDIAYSYGAQITESCSTAFAPYTMA